MKNCVKEEKTKIQRAKVRFILLITSNFCLLLTLWWLKNAVFWGGWRRYDPPKRRFNRPHLHGATPPEDGILHSHRRENLKSYLWRFFHFLCFFLFLFFCFRSPLISCLLHQLQSLLHCLCCTVSFITCVCYILTAL
jgi:hypothetical protein